MCFDVSFSSLAYNLILAESGTVYEMGFSAAQDIDMGEQLLKSHSYQSLGSQLQNSKSHRSLSKFQHHDRKFLRPVESLKYSSTIIQAIAGRVSIALSDQNAIYIWDCLKINSIQVIELQYFGIYHTPLNMFVTEEK